MLAALKEQPHRSFQARKKGETVASVDGQTLAYFMSSQGFSRSFRDDCLYPLLAGICTCFFEDMDAYPAATVLDFCGSGMVLEGASVVARGVRDVCETLSARVARVHLDAGVRAVTPLDGNKKE